MVAHAQLFQGISTVGASIGPFSDDSNHVEETTGRQVLCFAGVEKFAVPFTSGR
jgi:hypothetical protein